MSGACERCRRRTWLVERLGGRLQIVRARIGELLALDDQDLIDAVGGAERAALREEHRRWRPHQTARDSAQAGPRLTGTGRDVAVVCRCEPAYPARLRDLDAPPAVLHVAGSLERLGELYAERPVALVGSRRAGETGRAVSETLGRELSAAGLTVVSGLAAGIDVAAHRGAVSACGRTIAVLPGAVDRPYPARHRSLHRRLLAAGGVAVSERAPGARIWGWAFPARNRIIAALAELTVVVEAGAGSGALITAAMADSLDRPVAAVPGRVTDPRAAGSNELLVTGADAVRDAGDVLDLLLGPGHRPLLRPPPSDETLSAPARRLLSAVGCGEDTANALAGAGFESSELLALVAELELAGRIGRGAGGRLIVLP